MALNQKQLLSILGLLLLLKFIIVPVLDWQNSLVEELSIKEQRLLKSVKAVDESKELTETLEQLTKKNEQLQSLLFEHKPDTEFQLKQQQLVEGIFEENEIEISNIGWSPKSYVEEWQLTKFELRINFSGNISKLQNVKLLLESQEKWVELSEFNFRFGKKRLGREITVSGNMKLNYYMKESV